MTESERPSIFVTVGTDHHPFNRLIEWVDAWLAVDRPVRVRSFVQSGTSNPPRHAAWKGYLSPEEMATASGGATAVVSHGGPGTIISCRSRGVVPIVVPRQRRWGEAVDDHQVVFTRRMAERREIFLAESRADLWAWLDAGLREPSTLRTTPHTRRSKEVAERLARLVEDLVTTSRPPFWRRRREPAARLRRS
jgi:UDP-N-acetylglucosamine transferase subunit ALG13